MKTELIWAEEPKSLGTMLTLGYKPVPSLQYCINSDGIKVTAYRVPSEDTDILIEILLDQKLIVYRDIDS
jgi:hypothetical protein